MLPEKTVKFSKKSLLGWIGVIALIFGIRMAADQGLARGLPPPITGQTLAGTAFDLAQLRGRPAIVYFWASWCPICRAMQGSVREVAMDHPLVSLAMQSGSRDEVLRYQKEQDFDVPTLLDEDGDLAGRFGLRGVPAVFVLAPDGRIRFATAGYTSELGMRLRLWLAEF